MVSQFDGGRENGDDSASQIGGHRSAMVQVHSLSRAVAHSAVDSSSNRVWKRGGMQNGQRLRLTRSAMAIAQREERHVAIMVPQGAIIEVIGGPFNGTRLMDVRYDGEMIMMFTDDMKTHTEVVKSEVV
jgi:hypothetical protein